MNSNPPLFLFSPRKKFTRFLAAGAAILVAATSAHAAVLSVDFVAPVQTGFLGYAIPADGVGPFTSSFSVSDPTVPSGTVNFTIASGSDPVNMSSNINGINARFRGTDRTPANNGAYTQFDLFSGRLVGTGGVAGDGLFIKLDGFTPNTQFSLQAWGVDWQPSLAGAKPGTFTLYDRTNNTNISLGSFTTTAGAVPVDNNSFSVTGLVTSDANGTIVFESISNIDGNGIFNGFVLTAVPEPASLALLFIGICAVVAFKGDLARRRADCKRLDRA